MTPEEQYARGLANGRTIDVRRLGGHLQVKLYGLLADQLQVAVQLFTREGWTAKSDKSTNTVTARIKEK